MKTQPSLNRIHTLVLALLMMSMTDFAAMAQPSGIDLLDSPPMPELPNAEPSQLFAQRLVILAHGLADGPDQPSDAQLQVMSQLLEQASNQDERNVEILRLRIELARRMNRPEIQLQLLQRYLALQPQDDAAQLDLILLHLGKAQTVEARLAMLNRLLDAPGNSSFSSALRSRLASLAAAAAMEIGDTPTFQNRLRLAARLDPSNRQAMEMIAGSMQARESTPLERGVAALGLLQADPLNPLHRRALADLLLEAGAFDQAADQYTAAQRLVANLGDESFYRAWVTALVISGRSDQALTVLQGLEQSLAQVDAPDLAAGNAANAARTRLPVALEMLRYAILARREAQEPLRQCVQRLTQWVHLSTAASTPETVYLESLELTWLQVALGPMEQVDPLLEEVFAKDLSPNQSNLQARVRGYAAMRQGKSAQARTFLEPLADQDPAARLALAMMLEGGAQGGRTQALVKLLSEFPVGLIAVMAAQELQDQRIPVPITSTGLTLGKQLRQLPRAVREVDFVSQPWLQLSVEPSAPDFNYLEPIIFKVSLRNMSDIPLAMEPEGPIPSKLMVLLQPGLMGRMLPNFPPIVVDLRRKLVLRPRETLELAARLDVSEFGGLLVTTPAERVTFAGQVALDVRAMQGDRVQVGPLGHIQTLRSMERYGLGLTLRSLDGWLAALEEPALLAPMRAASWLLAVHPRLGGTGPEVREIADRIRDALLKRYDTADPLLQAWMAGALQTDGRGDPTLPALHERLRKNEHPLVRLIYLAAQVADPNAPALDAAIKGDDAMLSEFAQALRVVLEERARRNAANSAP